MSLSANTVTVSVCGLGGGTMKLEERESRATGAPHARPHGHPSALRHHYVCKDKRQERREECTDCVRCGKPEACDNGWLAKVANC